jgi:hypothetical protein
MLFDGIFEKGEQLTSEEGGFSSTRAFIAYTRLILLATSNSNWPPLKFHGDFLGYVFVGLQ